MTLLSAPIEMAGDWGHMLPRSAEEVVERMRHSCLDGVRLVSDRQPTRLRVDEHTSGNPAIWLHPDGSTMAWIIVDIGERDWSKLAYQFGHELGHVMANSWEPDAKPASPCGWLEEAMVEAFSIHGLGRLAESWKTNPPFPNDGAFGEAIADYRRKIIQGYTGTRSGARKLDRLWLVVQGSPRRDRIRRRAYPVCQGRILDRSQRIRKSPRHRRGVGRSEPLARP